MAIKRTKISFETLMNQCLKTIFVKTMVKIFNNSKTSGWSTYYCIVFMFFSFYQTSVTHCNFLGSNHRKISIFWLRLELLEVNVKTIKNIPFIWQLLKKKAKKNLAILVVLRKKNDPFTGIKLEWLCTPEKYWHFYIRNILQMWLLPRFFWQFWCSYT